MQNAITIHATYNLVNTLPKVMHLSHVTTIEAGKRSGYTQSAISKLAHGAANLPFENVKALLRAFPDHQEELALDIAHQFTGGITPPVANGSRLFDQSLSFAAQLMPELQQSIKALTNALDEFSGPADMIHGTDDPKEAVIQLLDVIFFGENAAIIFCHEYGFSLQELEKRREKLWMMKKYIE